MKPYGPEIKPRVVKPKAPRPKYQWPANKITSNEMAVLYHLRARTGTPINKLLQEAIRKFGETSLPQIENETPARDVAATSSSEDSAS